MTKINYKITVWAREAAQLEIEDAAKKLGFKDDAQRSAAQKLQLYEDGTKPPSRALLLKMSRVYRTPLLTFFLNKHPERGDRGEDFRTLPEQISAEQNAYVDVLVRDIRARQRTVRETLILEDEDTRLRFIGSCTTNMDVDDVANHLSKVLSFNVEEFRTQKDYESAFKLLRTKAEQTGVFVILKGNLGSHHSNVDVTVFRGFALSDDIAPFIVINDLDAKSAWSFTLLHEMTHLLLGQTGISGAIAEKQIEKYCNDVASQVLLPDSEFHDFKPSNMKFEGLTEEITDYAFAHKVSSGLVAYRLHRRGDINKQIWTDLREFYRQKWIEQRDRLRKQQKNKSGGPDFYVVKRYKLGSLVGLVQRLAASGAISTTKAGMLLDVRPLKVYGLFNNASPP